MTTRSPRSAWLLSLGTFGTALAVPRGLAFLLLPFLTAAVGPDGYGIYASAVAAAGLVGIVAGLGLEHATTYQYFRLESARTRERVMRTFWLASTLAALSVTAVVAVGVHLLGVPVGGLSADLLLPALLTAALTSSALAVPMAILRCAEERRPFLALAVAQGGVTAALSLVAVLGLGLGVRGWLWSTTAGAVAACAVAVVRLRPWRRVGVALSSLAGALRYSLPLLPHAFALTALQTGDRLVIGSIGTAGDAGVYALAVTMALPVLLLVQASHQTLVPAYSRAAAGSGKDDLSSIANRHITLVALAALAWSTVAPALVVVLFADGFRDAALLIPVTSFSAALMGVYLVPMARLTLVAGQTGRAWIVTVAASATALFAVGGAFAAGGLELAPWGIVSGLVVLTAGMGALCRLANLRSDLCSRSVAAMLGVLAVGSSASWTAGVVSGSVVPTTIVSGAAALTLAGLLGWNARGRSGR